MARPSLHRRDSHREDPHVASPSTALRASGARDEAVRSDSAAHPERSRGTSDGEGTPPQNTARPSTALRVSGGVLEDLPLRDPISIEAVQETLVRLQDEICAGLEEEDGGAKFREDAWEKTGDGGGRARVLEDGPVFEKAAVLFSHLSGADLPKSATASRPVMEGRPWEAIGLSLIVHPRNPYVPAAHLNLRFFLVTGDGDPVWWFGGGYDLTPVYGFEEDAIHWHQTAKRACDDVDELLYPRFKKACDEYFYLKHRGEARGVGGIFFDDFDDGGFANGFSLLCRVGDSFLPAYRPIVARRKATPFGEPERAFQLLRRGRYAEFNLAYDRGTRFGVHSGGRMESILASMPPLAAWRYDWHPQPGTAEARLTEFFLQPRDWASGGR